MTDKVTPIDKLTGQAKEFDAQAAAQEEELSEADLKQAQAAKALEDAGLPFYRNDKGGVVASSQENVRNAVHNIGITLRYNTFADRLLWRRDGGEEDVINDNVVDDIWLEIDKTFRFRPTQQFFRTVLLADARTNSFHPVRDYLSGLVWDQQPRVDDWLHAYGGAASTEYVRAVGAIVLIAAVRRVRHPGCKFDEMLVLEGDQGVSKSEALAALCPDPVWFNDDMPLSAGAKEVIERTAGRWIIEAAELSGMRKADIEHMKSFLSRRSDVARLAYDRITTERARHFIVIGTTNSKNYLRDDTGNRRFWPVEIERFDIEKLTRDRNQLWAEAAHREAAGEPIRLPQKLWELSAIEQEQRRVEDPWEAVIARSVGNQQGKIRAQVIWHLVAYGDVSRRTQADNQRLGAVMRRLGFERKKLRFDGSPPEWAYVRGHGHTEIDWKPGEI